MMGTSTDGIICFGFMVGEEEEPPEFLDGFEDFDEYLDSLSGLPAYGEPGHSFDDQRKFRESCPADMVIHCSYDYPMYILAMRGTIIRARRGYPVELDLSFFTSFDNAKEQEFLAWCEERELLEGDPKWYLCSLWG